MNKSRIRLTESQLRRVINESVKNVLKEENSDIQRIASEYSRYMSANDRLTQEGRYQEALQALRKAEECLMQLAKLSPENDMNRSNMQLNQQQGVKDGRGPEFFGRGREFGR